MNKISETTELLDRLARLVHNDHKSSDLNVTQSQSLYFFSRANKFTANIAGLTHYIDGISKAALSSAVMGLEEKKLIVKRKHPVDGRSAHIVVTAKGQKLLEKNPLRAIALSIHQLPQDDIQQLHRTLHDILFNTLDNRGGKPFGICRSCRYFKHNQGNPHFCQMIEVDLGKLDIDLICQEYEPILSEFQNDN